MFFRNGTSVGLCYTALPSKASCDWSTSTTKAMRWQQWGSEPSHYGNVEIYLRPEAQRHTRTCSSSLALWVRNLKHGFTIREIRKVGYLAFRTGHHVLAANTHTDMEEWMSSIQEAIMEDRQRNRRKKAQSMIVQQAPERNQSLSTPGTVQVPVTLQEPEISDVYEPNNSGIIHCASHLLYMAITVVPPLGFLWFPHGVCSYKNWWSSILRMCIYKQ